MQYFEVSEQTRKALHETRKALDTIREFLKPEYNTQEEFVKFQMWFFNVVKERINYEFEDFFFENVEGSEK